MEINFEQLITEFNLSSVSNDVLQQIKILLEQQTDEILSSFVSQNYHLLIKLEHKIWQLLSLNSQQWDLEFFQILASFNKKIIFNHDNIENNVKLSLLIPENIDEINNIFQQIEQISGDDNDLLIIIASLWFDNLAFLVHEYPQFGHLSIIIHINQYFGEHFLMNKQFNMYLIELHQSSLIFTAKQLFYMKTCPFSLHIYFYTNPKSFNYTPEEVVTKIGEDYLQMIHNQSYTVELWSKELFTCIAHLIGFMRAFLWWDGEKGVKLKLLFPKEKILCDYIRALIRIISYQPFYKSLMTQWYNDETILIDSILLVLMNIVQTQNINWYFQSMTQLSDILLKLVELNVFFRIYLCAYGILSGTLTDEHLKELKITNNIGIVFFDMLEQAWHDPSKRYKQIPINYLLSGFLNLSKNDFVQQGTAKSNGISLFIELCDQYPMVFDIMWGLSFNKDIQQQIRASSLFMSKLAHLAKDSNNEEMRTTIHGILWNLEINHNDHSTTDINDKQTFDIMISYSHKEKTLCQQIYDELTKKGYRVWIDFDQMHGNVMDAMAQAIERSQTVIICMSEEYRKSNYCRAEAHYAFQRQRKIVPVLLQKHYKPDGWLLFLIGQLLYVNFTKYEFNRAMKILLKELKIEHRLEINIVAPVTSMKEIDVSSPPVSVTSSVNPSISLTRPKNILEWTQVQVQDWLLSHNLLQMSRLLTNCDGRSLFYLNNYMKSCESQQILNLLQEDSLRRTKQNISLVELSCFHSLMDQQKQVLQSMGTNINIKKTSF